MKPLVICGGYRSYPIIYAGLKKLLSGSPYNFEVSIVPLCPHDWTAAPKLYYKNILAKLDKTVKEIFSRNNGTWHEKRAYKIYSYIVGNGELYGDGVVPLDSSVLDGAENIILSNIYHSPFHPPWYGSEKAFQYWGKYLLDS